MVYGISDPACLNIYIYIYMYIYTVDTVLGIEALEPIVRYRTTPSIIRSIGAIGALGPSPLERRLWRTQRPQHALMEPNIPKEGPTVPNDGLRVSGHREPRRFPLNLAYSGLIKST